MPMKTGKPVSFPSSRAMWVMRRGTWISCGNLSNTSSSIRNGAFRSRPTSCWASGDGRMACPPGFHLLEESCGTFPKKRGNFSWFPLWLFPVLQGGRVSFPRGERRGNCSFGRPSACGGMVRARRLCDFILALGGKYGGLLRIFAPAPGKTGHG